jgi:hypothetical protein
LAVHGCETTRTLDDKTKCEGLVTMCWGCFALIDELQATVYGVGRERGLCTISATVPQLLMLERDNDSFKAWKN